jgi:hypothetical protein
VFFCGGLATFLKGLKSPKYFIISAILFAISLHTYNAAVSSFHFLSPVCLGFTASRFGNIANTLSQGNTP